MRSMKKPAKMLRAHRELLLSEESALPPVDSDAGIGY